MKTKPVIANRCLNIMRLLREKRDELRKIKPTPKLYIDQIESLMALLNRAAHFIIEINPLTTLEDISLPDDIRGSLLNFFVPPYREFILDFPPVKHIRGNSDAPFMVIQDLGNNTLFIQNLTIIGDVDQERFRRETFDPKFFDGQHVPESIQEAVMQDTLSHSPIAVDSFLITAQLDDWGNTRLTWSTLGNDSCQFNSPEQQQVWFLTRSIHPDFPFVVCPFLSEERSKGCKGLLNSQCQEVTEQDQQLWFLALYAILYIDLPSNIVYVETPAMTEKERRQTTEGKKSFAVNPKKPIHRVIHYRELSKRVRRDRIGSHESPSPYQTGPYWMSFKSKRYTNMRGKRIRIAAGRRVGDFNWSTADGHLHFRVVEPPGKKAKLEEH